MAEENIYKISNINNHLYFFGEINNQSAFDFIKTLKEITYSIKNYEYKYEIQNIPIHIHINSIGGSLIDAFALSDTLQQLNIPIYTYVEGTASSAATLISLVGNKRFITKNSTILIHQLSSIAWGKFEELKDSFINNKTFMQLIINFYLKHTKMSKKLLNTLLKHDIFLNSIKCKKYGLVDIII